MTAFSPREIVSELHRYIVRRSMRIAGEICVYTNANVVIESIEA